MLEMSNTYGYIRVSSTDQNEDGQLHVMQDKQTKHHYQYAVEQLLFSCLPLNHHFIIIKMQFSGGNFCKISTALLAFILSVFAKMTFCGIIFL